MKMKSFLSYAFILSIFILYSSCRNSDFKDFMPENDLKEKDNVIIEKNVSEKQFYEIISKVQTVFEPIIAMHSSRLAIDADWENPIVNATATQVTDMWIINMYGGLARRSEITPDGFSLVLCHEVGHHLGGFNFAFGSPWASNEGNSDYFATYACARYLWEDDLDVNAAYRNIVEAYPKQKCDSVWTRLADQNLCYRISMAGKSVANLLAQGRNPVAFNTPDPSEVSVTDDLHPEAQCRLDSMLAGALCTNSWNFGIIPGKDLPEGNNTRAAQREADLVTCSQLLGYEVGLKPRCWYKP
jgi:hypothetical protein